MAANLEKSFSRLGSRSGRPSAGSGRAASFPAARSWRPSPSGHCEGADSGRPTWISALGSFSLLVYGALGTPCATTFFYLVAHHDVATIAAVAVFVLFILLIIAVLTAYAAYRRSPHPEGLAEALVLRAERLLPHRGALRGPAADREGRLAATLRRKLRVAGEELLGRPSRLVRLVALAFRYWPLDALCLFFVLSALGTGVEPWQLLVAYATAQLVAALPFMPPGVSAPPREPSSRCSPYSV